MRRSQSQLDRQREDVDELGVVRPEHIRAEDTSAPVMILAPASVSPSLYCENQPEVSVKLTATSPTSCASFSSIPTRAAPVQE